MIGFLLLPLLAAFAQCSSTNANCTGVNAIAPSCSSPESFYKRDVFWVGGHYVDAPVGTLTYDQIYVEKLTPLGGVQQPYPIVLFHGGASSGAVSEDSRCS